MTLFLADASGNTVGYDVMEIVIAVLMVLAAIGIAGFLMTRGGSKK